MEADQIFCPSCGAANQKEANFCFKCGGKIPHFEQPVVKEKTSDFITLQCPKCGGKLQVEPDTQQLTCQYCGLEHLVRQSGDTFTLTPVVESIKRVEGKFEQMLSGSDRIAAEQTIERLKKEMPAFEFRAKDLELKYNRELKKKPSKLLIGLLVLLIFISSAYAFIVVIGTLFEGIPPEEVIIVLLFSLFIFAVSVWGLRSIRRKAKNKEHIKVLQNELEKAQQEYQTRKNQLEQLHRYTAER